MTTMNSNNNTDFMAAYSVRGNNASSAALGVDLTVGQAQTLLQITPSPLTTKGDLYTYSTVATRLAVGSSDGQMLQVSSGSATGLAWSTPTYPSASGTSGKMLQSDGTNIVYSTPTYPATAGTTGNILTSDGTNFVSSAPAVQTFNYGLTYIMARGIY